VFKPVQTHLELQAVELAIRQFWDEHRVFNALREKNAGGPRFSFIDGPITANNPMGVHHAWGRTYKDIFQRYKAMHGYQLRYQNGFDCQGLWVEVEVEKQLGFASKRDIEEYGIDRFVEKCKERVLKYAAIQTEQSKRLGYWMDWDNSYYTMSDENNYTIWLFLKRCYEREWVYWGHDVMPWCPRCGSVLSEHEIATEGYRLLTHDSVFLQFPVLDSRNEYLLVWTTTPWTLTSNVACAVHPDLPYVRARRGEDVWILAQGALPRLGEELEVLETIPGSTLVGLAYRGPFDELPPQKGIVHRVIPWKEVSADEGTGIVHIAPGCGKEDFSLSKEHNLPVVAPLDEFGNYRDGFGWLTGRSAADVANDIFTDLQSKGMLLRVESYDHRYPVCWRCSTELVFRLVDEWFIRMDDLRHQIMEVAKRITWMPSFGLERELDWLRNMHDWCISKKRYWGLALPIYQCSCGAFEVIGGRSELQERAVRGWDAFDGHSPHRPWIDEVLIECRACGKEVPRIKDVGTPWLDAGIVPYSTLGYLHDRDYWEKWFPAEFITECFPGQYRNWFYSLLAMSTVLENREPFQLVLGHAVVRDEQGEEMHKSRGNAIQFEEAADRMGVETMRWIFARQNPSVNLNFGFRLSEDIKRKLLTLWNSYSFLVTYASLDDINPRELEIRPHERSLLDRWLLSKMELLTRSVDDAFGRYAADEAVRAIETFWDDLSTWYIRRSRRRFWKGEDDADKRAAFKTLYEALARVCLLIAPVLPFLSEELYQNLVRGADPDAPVSVHLSGFPHVNDALIDESLVGKMELARKLVSLGRAARQKAGVRVRQPLPRALLKVPGAGDRASMVGLQRHILEELNVKTLEFVDEATQVRTLSVSLKRGAALGHADNVDAVRKALASANPELLARDVASGQAINLKVGGKDLAVPADQLEVDVKAKGSLAVAEEGDLLVAVDLKLTDDLRREGLVRDLVRRIQKLRKDSGLSVDDRITTYLAGSASVRAAVEAHREYLLRETLTEQLLLDAPPPDTSSASFRVADEEVSVGVALNSGSLD
jgi:isoleucyl-tRNA synthetase